MNTKGNVKLKIAIYLPTASTILGGGEVVTLMKAKYLSQLGHLVHFVYLEVKNPQPYFANFKKDNSQIHFIGIGLHKKYGNFVKSSLTHEELHQLYWSLSRQVSELFLKNSYDLVYTHYSPANLSVPSGTPLLLSLQGVDTKWWYEDHIAVRHADKLTADSVSIAEGWTKIYSLKSKIDVLHNGIDEISFYPTKSAESVDILYIGRLIETKGVQYLLKAIHILKNKFKVSKLNVLIIGKGAYREQLMALATDLELNSFVKFKEYLPEEAKNKTYNNSKVCVFPSFAKEGVLTTMLEAASAGRAIITTNCCGMVDFMKQDRNGYLSNPQDEIDLANKIFALISDKNLRERLGSAARKEILSRWTWKKTILKLEKIMMQLSKNGKN